LIKYFVELLNTLKSIDSRLAKIEENTERLAQCVRDNDDFLGDKTSISTRHWKNK